ncbi:MAG TPA: heavy-metal-associated domain-containing protein [Vicinamibacterales bacterium]|nr:heavy-metal-associated domain-containing protein [Vicinamibacterales bacterium]
MSQSSSRRVSAAAASRRPVRARVPAARTAIAGLALLTAMWMTPLAARQAREAPKIASCTLQVSGMTCGGCAAAVRSAAKKVEGVLEATVSHEKGTAEITYDPSKTTPEAIAKAITHKTGFTARVSRRGSS